MTPPTPPPPPVGALTVHVGALRAEWRPREDALEAFPQAAGGLAVPRTDRWASLRDTRCFVAENIKVYLIRRTDAYQRRGNWNLCGVIRGGNCHCSFSPLVICNTPAPCLISIWSIFLIKPVLIRQNLVICFSPTGMLQKQSPDAPSFTGTRMWGRASVLLKGPLLCVCIKANSTKFRSKQHLCIGEQLRLAFVPKGWISGFDRDRGTSTCETSQIWLKIRQWRASPSECNILCSEM